MNKTRIIELRQAQGWTQERLANKSGIGLRTVQRLEAGQDASLETLSLVADALQVSVRDLFSEIDDAGLSSRVDSLENRALAQQVARDRISGAWRWLYVGIGIVLTLVSFTFSHGAVLFFSYWIGGIIILVAIRRIYLEPHLDEKYPLSRGKTPKTRSGRRKRRANGLAGDSTGETAVATSGVDEP